jgi:hypothetical protein
MKRNIAIFFLIFSLTGAVYAQSNPVVGVMVFENTRSISPMEALNLTNRVIAELTSWGTLNVVQGSAGAEYIIKGGITRQGTSFVLSASTINAKTEEVLNVYNEQASSIAEISIFLFCAKAVENVPIPNYLAGTWQSTINMPDGPVVCIIEFRRDRSIRVERYDTWEHRQMNALRYEGYGSGSYTYAGFANRTVTIDSKPVRVDATFNVYLRLEETLPEQTSVNRAGLHIIYNGDRSAFEIPNGALPCGRNYDGPSVHPSTTLGFSSFTKIR